MAVVDASGHWEPIFLAGMPQIQLEYHFDPLPLFSPTQSGVCYTERLSMTLGAHVLQVSHPYFGRKSYEQGMSRVIYPLPYPPKHPSSLV